MGRPSKVYYKITACVAPPIVGLGYRHREVSATCYFHQPERFIANRYRLKRAFRELRTFVGRRRVYNLRVTIKSV